MVWPHPRDVIYCTPDQVTFMIICLLYAFISDILSDFKTCFGLKSRNFAGTFAISLRFLTSRQHVFRLWFHACNLLNVT